MQNSSDLRKKEVISVDTAERLGYVCDIDVDIATGRINSIILPSGGILGQLFRAGREIVIPWSSVVAVGSEFILVKTLSDSHLSRKCNI